MIVCTDVSDTIDAKRLRWYRHVCREGNDRWPKRLLEWTPLERMKRGRPRQTWMEGIRNATAQRNLKDGDWKDRKVWKLG